MARIRSIKPEFFNHEGLADLTPLHRLLFIGLWTLADRHGRLEDRPRRIKAALLPWEDCDMGALLADLEAAGFIARYVATHKGKEEAVIWIPTFGAHQKPHPKESEFDLPPPGPDVFSREVSRLAVAKNEARVPADSLPLGVVVGSLVSGSLVSGGGSGSEPPPPLKERGPVVYEKPTTNSDSWSADEFFAWAQFKRQEAGFLGERRKPRDLGAWYSGALMALRGDVEALKESFYRFGEDKHWQGADPPLPFQAFVSQYDKYVPRRRAANAGA